MLSLGLFCGSQQGSFCAFGGSDEKQSVMNSTEALFVVDDGVVVVVDAVPSLVRKSEEIGATKTSATTSKGAVNEMV